MNFWIENDGLYLECNTGWGERSRTQERLLKVVEVLWEGDGVTAGVVLEALQGSYGWTEPYRQNRQTDTTK